MDEAQVAFGKTPGDSAAVSALVHAMVKQKRVGGENLGKSIWTWAWMVDPKTRHIPTNSLHCDTVHASVSLLADRC